MRRLAIAAIVVAALGLRADIVNCACDASHPESIAVRQCTLCREAEKQPADINVFFLKDKNPRKPNRWLALPRTHVHEPTDQLTPKARLALLNAAIEKAKCCGTINGAWP